MIRYFTFIKGEAYILDDRSDFLFTHTDSLPTVKRYSWDNGLIGNVCLSGKSITIDDAVNDHRFDGQVDSYIEAYSIGTMLVVPILDINTNKPYGKIY